MLRSFHKLKKSGQTMVEYVLFMVVLIGIIIVLFGKIKQYILGDGGQCTPASRQLICRIERAVSFGQGSAVDLQDRFRTFRL